MALRHTVTAYIRISKVARYDANRAIRLNRRLLYGIVLVAIQLKTVVRDVLYSTWISTIQEEIEYCINAQRSSCDSTGPPVSHA